MERHSTEQNETHVSPDENLWKSFLEGNEKALSAIFLNNYETLYKYASRLISNEDDAKDIIQELFLKLWKNRNNLGGCNAIKYYLLQSVRRLILDQYQKKTKHISVEINENILPAELPFESILITDQEQEIQLQKLKKSFSLLSKRQQEAIYLRYYQQIDYPEIANIMVLNVQSVRNHVHSAIQVLKNQLGNSIIFFLALLKKVKK